MRTAHDAIRDLGARKDAGALTTLADTARSGDQCVRRAAIEVIGRHPHGRELSAVILNALEDGSEYVQRAACDVVAQWELSEARGAVVALLMALSQSTRRVAIRTLGAIWQGTDFPLLFRIYAGASEIEIRREAAWVLRQHATSAQWRTLFDAFSIDELPRHRQWACELAESFSGSDILPVLSQLLSDDDGHVRKTAARAIQVVSNR
jgi:HEAT repeat protein